MAARIKVDLLVVHVVGSETVQKSGGDDLERLRRLTSDLGAQWNEVVGDDPANSLMEVARRQQITQIVVGSSQRSRWQELRGGGSIVRRILRLADAEDIDVHVIARRHVPNEKIDGKGQSSNGEHAGTPV